MGMDKKQLTLLLQFEYSSKAFNTISPSKLLEKLRRLGFYKSALQWFWSYLSGCSQCVFTQSTPASFRESILGIPQGSVLGRLLFCLYMNDLRLHLNIARLLRLLYINDLQIYIQVPLDLIHHGIHLLSEASCRVAEWANSNYLKLNAGKIKAIAFGTCNAIRRFKELQTTSIVINSNGDRAQFVEEVVCLGVVLDRTVFWGPHIIHIIKKVNRAQP